MPLGPHCGPVSDEGPQARPSSDAARSGRGPWLVTLASKSGSAWCARVTRGDDGSFIEEMGEVLDAIGFLPKVSAVAAAGGVVLATVVRQADAHTRAIAVDPCALAALAQLALSRNATTDPFALAPIYPREPEAVTKWRERHPPKP